MARNAGIDFLYPGDENQLFSMPKKNIARFANDWLLTHSADNHKSARDELLESAAGACPQILLVNCRELCDSCNQQLQPTAWQLRPISRHIASMKDQDGSGRSMNKRIHRMQKNVVIYI